MGARAWVLVAKLMLELGLLLVGLAVLLLVLAVLAAAAAAGKKRAAVGRCGKVFFGGVRPLLLLWSRMPRIRAASGESGGGAAAKLVRVLAPRRRQAASS